VPPQPQRSSSAAPSTSSSTQPSASGAATATAERPDLSDVRATPAVRKLASDNGIDISQIEGTGLGGRVSKKDVEDFIASAQAAPAQAEPAKAEPAKAEPAQAGRTRQLEQGTESKPSGDTTAERGEPRAGAS
jgi:2-oxoglutarate dehydrogenase E2 component (dihydrolipoamide succinyltransferase)